MTGHTFAITVYKESAYLEQCIQSIVNQTVKTNAIIVTSTPTEFSRDIAEKYGIPYHINSTEKKNAATNWNFAIEKAETDLVTVAHQDDMYQPDYAENVLNKFARHNNVQIAFTGYIDMINGKIRKYSMSAFVKSTLLLPFYFSEATSSNFFKRLVLLFGNPICCSSVTFNKALTGDQIFSDRYVFALDWFAWYEMSAKPGGFMFINKKLIIHRIHNSSVTAASSNNGAAKREEQAFFEMIWGNKFIARILSRVYRLGDLDNRS
jgi:cellulose synthase/poly-beta-1,6-N-acetylglucosamine synthase-like glycosyltransferase